MSFEYSTFRAAAFPILLTRASRNASNCFGVATFLIFVTVSVAVCCATVALGSVAEFSCSASETVLGSTFSVPDPASDMNWPLL